MWKKIKIFIYTYYVIGILIIFHEIGLLSNSVDSSWLSKYFLAWLQAGIGVSVEIAKVDLQNLQFI